MYRVLLCFMCFLGLGFGQLPLTRIGSKNYYVEQKNRTNWFLAYQFCRRNNLQLLTLPTQQEYDGLVSYLKTLPSLPAPLWASGTDYGREGSWVWMSTGQPMTYFNWKPTNPDNYGGNENCLEIQPGSNFQYNDINCNNQNLFICEETSGGSSNNNCGCCNCCCNTCGSNTCNSY